VRGRHVQAADAFIALVLEAHRHGIDRSVVKVR
jgi:hypothetical protein